MLHHLRDWLNLHDVEPLDEHELAAVDFADVEQHLGTAIHPDAKELLAQRLLLENELPAHNLCLPSGIRVMTPDQLVDIDLGDSHEMYLDQVGVLPRPEIQAALRDTPPETLVPLCFADYALAIESTGPRSGGVMQLTHDGPRWLARSIDELFARAVRFHGRQLLENGPNGWMDFRPGQPHQAVRDNQPRRTDPHQMAALESAVRDLAIDPDWSGAPYDWLLW